MPVAATETYHIAEPEIEQDDLVGAEEYDVWSEADGVNDRVRGYGVDDALTRWARDNVAVNDGYFVYVQCTTDWGCKSRLYFVKHWANEVEVELRECEV